eukprot:m.105883 g.105883  ORF g.105883 m.105883 type:complete len:139 (+) comp51663_c0_seq1:664-1080(+)
MLPPGAISKCAGSINSHKCSGNKVLSQGICVPGAAPTYNTFLARGPKRARNSISLRSSLRCPQCSTVFASPCRRAYGVRNVNFPSGYESQGRKECEIEGKARQNHAKKRRVKIEIAQKYSSTVTALQEAIAELERSWA